MTKQTWTAVVSAILFVALAAVIALSPVPFVVWAPGTTADLLGRDGDKQVVGVTGVTTYPTSGELRFTTVSVTNADARVSLPEALYAFWAPDREVLPRSAVYPEGASVDTVRAVQAQEMDSSQTDAVAAALQAAKLRVDRVPVVSSVATSGPAVGHLLPGDLIVQVDHRDVLTQAEVLSAVAAHKVGEQVVYTVERATVRQDITSATAASKTDPGLAVPGIKVDLGYRYAAQVTYSVDPAIGGPSAGLMFALAVYDKVTPGSLIGQRVVAGTGEIDGSGKVGAVGGVQEKVATAERAGASVFLLPAANCADLGTATPSLRIVKVTTVSDAVQALTALNNPTSAATVKGCS
jgi:PDZ domain-containing protein